MVAIVRVVLVVLVLVAVVAEDDAIVRRLRAADPHAKGLRTSTTPEEGVRDQRPYTKEEPHEFDLPLALDTRKDGESRRRALEAPPNAGMMTRERSSDSAMIVVRTGESGSDAVETPLQLRSTFAAAGDEATAKVRSQRRRRKRLTRQRG